MELIAADVGEAGGRWTGQRARLCIKYAQIRNITLPHNVSLSPHRKNELRLRGVVRVEHVT